jgi:RNA-binding protein
LADGLTGKQRRHLRALGHHLDPVVQIGHEGVNDAVVRETDAQLAAHELIKVKIGESSPQPRHEAAELLASRTRAQVAQVLGRTALLYRRREKDPKVVLPK